MTVFCILTWIRSEELRVSVAGSFTFNMSNVTQVFGTGKLSCGDTVKRQPSSASDWHRLAILLSRGDQGPSDPRSLGKSSRAECQESRECGRTGRGEDRGLRGQRGRRRRRWLNFRRTFLPFCGPGRRAKTDREDRWSSRIRRGGFGAKSGTTFGSWVWKLPRFLHQKYRFLEEKKHFHNYNKKIN